MMDSFERLNRSLLVRIAYKHKQLIEKERHVVNIKHYIVNLEKDLEKVEMAQKIMMHKNIEPTGRNFAIFIKKTGIEIPKGRLRN